jgi:hypothetical protein
VPSEAQAAQAQYNGSEYLYSFLGLSLDDTHSVDVLFNGDMLYSSKTGCAE